MNEYLLLQAVGEIGDDLVEEAEIPARRIPWIKLAAACLVLIVGLLGTYFMTRSPVGEYGPIETWGITYSSDQACYVRGFESLEEILEYAPVVVRAVPVELVEETPYGRGVILRLKVLESNVKGLKELYLFQPKKEHIVILKGEEVVLAVYEWVGYDWDEDVYCVPNGNYGMFREDRETGRVGGHHIEELEGYEKITLKEVYAQLAATACVLQDSKEIRFAETEISHSFGKPTYPEGAYSRAMTEEMLAAFLGVESFADWEDEVPAGWIHYCADGTVWKVLIELGEGFDWMRLELTPGELPQTDVTFDVKLQSQNYYGIEVTAIACDRYREVWGLIDGTEVIGIRIKGVGENAEERINRFASLILDRKDTLSLVALTDQ